MPHEAVTQAQRAQEEQPEPEQEFDNASIGSAGERWYVVQTQPHGETKAVFHLERQDYRVFCPCMRKTVRHARKLTHVLAPLFPNYLFLRMDVTRQHWRSVNGTFGVSRLIMQNDMPQSVQFGVVEAIKARLGEDGAIDWASSLKIGQPVKICDGPFADFVGTLERLDASGRVRVLLDLMGRAVCVSTRSEMLAPAA
jgi:transcriptional antiterminator RfaH